MKKVLALVLVLMMVLTACCGVLAEGKLDKIKAAGKLVVATDPAWAPFEYIGVGGEITGSDIEIAKYLAAALGVELEMVSVYFDSIPIALVNDEADLSITAMTITEERQETLDFSIPYTIAQQYIIVAEDNDKVATIEDLAGMNIGVHLGTTGDFLVSDECLTGVLMNTGAQAMQYKALPEAALALKSGELGAIVCDTLLAENLVKVNSGLKCFPLTYKDGTANIEELGIAFKKGDAEFVNYVNELLAVIIEDGSVDQWIITHTELASELD